MVNQDLMDRALGEFTRVVPRLYRRIQSFRLTVAKELEVSRAQMEIISLLSHRGPLSLTEIAQALVLAKSNVTLTLDDLGRRGLVTRENHQEDRRIILHRLTDQGTEIQRQIQQRFRALVVEGLSVFDEEQMGVLIHGLESLGAMVDQMGGDPA